MVQGRRPFYTSLSLLKQYSLTYCCPASELSNTVHESELWELISREQDGLISGNLVMELNQRLEEKAKKLERGISLISNRSDERLGNLFISVRSDDDTLFESRSCATLSMPRTRSKCPAGGVKPPGTERADLRSSYRPQADGRNAFLVQPCALRGLVQNKPTPCPVTFDDQHPEGLPGTIARDALKA
jgi:hypothetical protein